MIPRPGILDPHSPRHTCNSTANTRPDQHRINNYRPDPVGSVSATGSVVSVDRSILRVRLQGDEAEGTATLPERADPYDDPFAYLAAVVKGRIQPEPFDLSSLDNNLLVVEILDAARESARTGRRVVLP